MIIFKRWLCISRPDDGNKVFDASWNPAIMHMKSDIYLIR